MEIGRICDCRVVQLHTGIGVVHVDVAILIVDRLDCGCGSFTGLITPSCIG